MTQISRDDVLHLADLSSLQLSDSEVAAIQADLGSILTYIDQLNELDTEGVEPTYQITGLENVWRDDVIDAGEATREELLELAPSTRHQQIEVPKVL